MSRTLNRRINNRNRFGRFNVEKIIFRDARRTSWRSSEKKQIETNVYRLRDVWRIGRGIGNTTEELMIDELAEKRWRISFRNFFFCLFFNPRRTIFRLRRRRRAVVSATSARPCRTPRVQISPTVRRRVVTAVTIIVITVFVDDKALFSGTDRYKITPSRLILGRYRIGISNYSRIRLLRCRIQRFSG